MSNIKYPAKVLEKKLLVSGGHRPFNIVTKKTSKKTVWFDKKYIKKL